MEFNIRKLEPSDYNIYLVKWWKDWGWTPPIKDFLPEEGTGGILISDDKVPICAGFLYLTNSKVAWVDWIISNKKYTDRKNRKEALFMLIETLTHLAHNSKAKFCYALINHEPLKKIYKELGYTEGDKYNTEMIKAL